MESDELQLRLLGQHGRIDARALQRGLGGVLEGLKRVTGSADPSWSISALREGSACLAIRPSPGQADVMGGFAVFVEGLSRLDEAAEVPVGWDFASVHAIAQMRTITELPGVEGVEISWGSGASLRLDHRVFANASELSNLTHCSIGSVRGRLDRYINREGHREAGLVDRVSGEKVTVLYPEHLRADLVAALDRDILAWGELRRNAWGQRTRLHMEDFEVEEAVGAVASVDEMRGVLGQDWTGGLGSVDWVRAQRNDG